MHNENNNKNEGLMIGFVYLEIYLLLLKNGIQGFAKFKTRGEFLGHKIQKIRKLIISK